jgi:heat shock protein HslJ
MDLTTIRARGTRGAAILLAAAMVAGCAATPGPGGVPPVTGTGVPPVTAPIVPAAPPPPKLAGSSWYWLGTVTPAGVVAPNDPGGFNLEFLDGGQVAAQLDCNRGGASWSQDGNGLRFGPLKSTRAACATASEADRFGRQLALVRSVRNDMGLLELELGEAGTMVFSRDPDWRLRGFDCPSGPPVVAAFGRDQAVVRWNGRSWQMRSQPAASGARYGTGNAILFTKGNELSLLNEGKQLAGPCTSRR